MAFITRGTTPVNTFAIPADKMAVADVLITYSQNGSKVIEKEMSDCEVGDYYVSTKLTQEETLMLSAASPLQIQLKVKTGDEEVIVSEELVIGVKDCLNEEVM